MKSELLENIAKLKKLYKYDVPCINPENVEPVHINSFLSEISKRVDNFGKIKPNVDLGELYRHALWCFHHGINDFTIREINNLPFILFNPDMSMQMYKYILNDCIDETMESRIIILIHIYLTNYDDSEKISVLKNKIYDCFRGKKPEFFRKKPLQCLCKFKNAVFRDNTEREMCNLYKYGGLQNSLDELGITDANLRRSKFVVSTLEAFFKTQDQDKSKYKVFEELEALAFDGYLTIKPMVVSSIIRLTEALKDNKWKNKLVAFCTSNANFGDPRRNRNRWMTIDSDARKIFMQWLVTRDLKLFFKIIEKSAVDKVWKYRSKFWQAYLPYMTTSWFFFGASAQLVATQLAGDEPLDFGKATNGAAGNHSAFIFEIGNYVFCEWSHSGRLYIWNRMSNTVRNGVVEIGGYVLEKNKLTYSDYDIAIVHSGSDSYSWQQEVSDWIAVHCGISKTRKDWGFRR